MPSSETGVIGWETKYKDVRRGQNTSQYRLVDRMGQLIDIIQRTGDKDQSRETGYRGRETRSRAVRQGTGGRETRNRAIRQGTCAERQSTKT